MTQLKQKTVSVGNQSQTIALKRRKNTMSRGGKWMYVIVDKDTGGRIEDPFTNKQTAMREFRESARLIKRGMESGGGSSSFDSGADYLGGEGEDDLEFGLGGEGDESLFD